MSMRTIRRSFLRATQRQVHTAELGQPILRLILAVCLGIDFAVGHPLWPTVVLIGAVVTVLVFSARALRRAPPSSRAPEEQDR